MELSNLDGQLIGIVSDDFKKEEYSNKLVKDIILVKQNEAIKMVKLDKDVLSKNFDDLSSRDQNKVILASKLHDKEIILINFSKGMITKDLEYFKSLFKKISTYNRKIVLIDKNANLFLNCVDNIYVISNNNLIFHTTDIFDRVLDIYIDPPKIVEFFHKCENLGIRLDHYKELDDLLKAIYRIKS